MQDDDISAIKSAISCQEEEIKRLSVLEERRSKVLDSIDGQDGIERAGRMKDELEIEGSRLAARLQELAAVNETNRQLANQALTFATVVQEAMMKKAGKQIRRDSRR